MMKRFFLILLVCLTTLTACQKAVNTTQTYTCTTPHEVIASLPTVEVGQKPKNIVLIIGDGMGLPQMSTAWTANRGKLNMLACPYTGLSRTYCTDTLITDSDAGGTALACGQKTAKAHCGTDANGLAMKSLMGYAHDAGMQTGMSIVCTLCDATPADFCCHVSDRDEYDSICEQYLDCGVDYIVGGGMRYFTQREDGRNIYEEMAAKGYHTYSEVEQLWQATELPIFAVLSDDDYPKALERGNLFPRQTALALELLSCPKDMASDTNPAFFMMVEGSCIDGWSHANVLSNVVEEMLDFDRMVGEVLRYAAEDGETLVVITADHATGGLTLLGGNKEQGRVIGSFANDSHVDVHVPIYAYGPGAERFTGVMENAEVGQRLIELVKQ